MVQVDNGSGVRGALGRVYSPGSLQDLFLMWPNLTRKRYSRNGGVSGKS